MKYSIHQAKTNLSQLLREACEGEEVVITRRKKPVAKLIPLSSARKKRTPGKLKGQISYSPDAFDPLTDSEVSELGFE